MTRIAKSPPACSNRLSAKADVLVDKAGTAFIAPSQLTTFERAASPRPALLIGNGAGSTPPRTLSRIPLLPSDLLKQHRCFVSTDTRFRAAARFLQSLWRGDANIAIGIHVSPKGDKPTRSARQVASPAAIASAAAQPGIHPSTLVEDDADDDGM